MEKKNSTKTKIYFVDIFYHFLFLCPKETFKIKEQYYKLNLEQL